MVKVTALYRWFEGAQFNHAYYQSEHMRITRDAVQPHGLLRLESEQVVATTSSYFPSVAAAQAALAEAGALLRADLPHYTNIKPELHVSAVMTHHSPSAQALP